jgi:D-3-phosphoglycerate dehydrogenase / 2-oxoglutarate reductase
MKKVLATDGMAPDGIAVFDAAEGIEIDVRKGVSAEELLTLIPGYDGLIVRSASTVTPEVMAAGKRLAVIGRAGVGVDNVDIAEASRRGIVVMNTPEANTISTAEHTVALLFSLARRTPEGDATMKQGKWEKKNLKGVELYGKTLGIIGYGRIGRWVGKICASVGMRIITYDPMVSTERVRETGASLVSLNHLFAESDFITLHTPVNNATRNLINAETIQKMKDGVRIINCARGAIVKEDDLCDGIDAGKIAGAALDVFPEEPNKNMRLCEYPQLILTPHIAASTAEAQSKVGVEIAKQIVEYLTTGIVTNAVNTPAMSLEQREVLMPFVHLGQKLGAMLAQITLGQVQSLEITYEGTLGAESLDTTPVTTSIMCGVLSYSNEEVNQINARIFANESGMDIKETKTMKSKSYQNYIQVRATHESAEPAYIGATVFGEDRNHPRIVRINGSHVDALPDDYMLIVEHKDIPGVIGGVGTILGKNGINIGRMTCDRMQAGDTNVGVFSTDRKIPDETLAKIRALSEVTKVYGIEL